MRASVSLIDSGLPVSSARTHGAQATHASKEVKIRARLDRCIYLFSGLMRTPTFFSRSIALFKSPATLASR